MALVFDPITQRLIDDGRPASAAGAVGNATQLAARGLVGGPPQLAQNLATLPQNLAAAVGPAVVPAVEYGPPQGLGLRDWATYGMRTPMVAAARAGNDFVGGRTAPATVGGPQFGAVGSALPPPAERQQGTPFLSQEILAQTNAGIATALAESRQQAPAAPAPRGNNGVNFGFGVGGSETARQYLDRMAAQDAEAAAQDAQGGIVRDILAEARGLSSTSSIGDIALARQRNALRQPALAATSDRATLATTGRQQREQEQLRAEVQLGVAGANNEAALEREIAGRTVAGQYGLMQAEADAMGRMALQQQKAESPEGILAQQRAIQLQLQQDAYVDALVNGDQATAMRIMANQGPGAVNLVQDPITGKPLAKRLPDGSIIPLTPEEASIFQQ